MNKARILELADIIENDSLRHMKFDMNIYLADDDLGCGSVGCIAGYAVAKWGDPETDKATWSEAEELLDLTPDEHGQLFEAPRIHYDLVTPQIAASVMREFVETGVVSWPKELELEINREN